MVRWRNLGVRTKLLLVVSMAGLGMAGIGVVGVGELRSVASTANEIATARMRQALNVDDARVALLQQDSALLGYPALIDDVSRRQAETDIQASDQDFDKAWAAYRKNSSGRVGTKQLIDTSVSFYRNIRDTVLLPAAKNGDTTGFRDARVQQSEALGVIRENLDKISSLENERVIAGSREIQKAERNSTRLLIVVLVVGLIAAFVAASLVATAIVRPVRKVEQALKAMANGDLTATVDVDSTDEVGRMAIAFMTARDAMRTTVTAIRGASGEVAKASDQVLRSEARIGESTAAAAQQVTYVVSSADLVSSQVQTLAAGAEETNVAMRSIAQAAEQAARVATEAVSAVEKTTDTVAELGDSSAQIGEVVKVITAIAEQTNLLALNATIEAARAGELGKGFAVVAGEVKDLARETASATEDIARRVEAIQGSSVGAVKAIGDISRIIDEINRHQATIASAVEEQAATSGEMSRNVVGAATGTQEIGEAIATLASSVHTAEQDGRAARVTADDLIATAEQLRDAVSRFRV